MLSVPPAVTSRLWTDFSEVTLTTVPAAMHTASEAPGSPVGAQRFGLNQKPSPIEVFGQSAATASDDWRCRNARAAISANGIGRSRIKRDARKGVPWIQNGSPLGSSASAIKEVV